MSDNGIEITSPVGRIVWGHPTKSKQKTDNETNAPIFKDGVPVMEWSFGLAIPRGEFEQLVWPAMYAEAAKGYPQGTPPKFSWKYTDGDTAIDPKGVPYNQREGYAGHIVLAVNTVFQAPNVFKLENGGYRQMQPDEIKCGDYVRVGLNFKVNIPQKPTHTPSLYVNPQAIEFIGYGTPIVSGFQADPTTMFGGQQVALPAGASATPIGGAAPAAMPGMGMGAPQQQGMPGQAPQYAPPMGNPAPATGPAGQPYMPGAPAASPSYAPPAPQQQYAPPQPGQMPPPAHDFVQNAGMAPAPQGMPGTAPFPGAMPPR